MDEEEQQNFLDKKEKKDQNKYKIQKSAFKDNKDRKSTIKHQNYFDRDRLTLAEVRDHLYRTYEKNKQEFEKWFIILVIGALVLALIGISIVLIQTFDSQNIQRRQYLLNDDVIKPINDVRNVYKLITLPNLLQVLIIANNSTQYSSVALDINSGSWQEPQQIPGLAHFLEHMSFCQSQKYNASKYFDTFLSVNGGYTNSFTSQDHTNYFFSVRSQELEKSLDIFAHMFIDPIYDLETAKREASIVESEFKISLQDDDQKIRYLLSQLSDPSHPFTRFTSGNQSSFQQSLRYLKFLRNVQSLRDNVLVNITEELEKFRETYYSSNLMKLVIFTDQEIERVEEYLLPFQDIPNIFADKPSFIEFQKPILNTKKMIKLQTHDENEVFYMVFQVDIDKSQYRKRPIEFISYFFNNQKDGGLKNYLKEKLDLIIDVEIGNVLDQQNYSIFFIKFHMQDKKLLKYNIVANAVMNYLEFIKKEGLEDQIYQQRAVIANLTFSYNGQTVLSEDNVSNFAWNLNEYDYKEVFAADSTWNESIDKNYIHSIINQMQDFDNIILIGGSSNFSNNQMDEINEEEEEEIDEREKKDITEGNINKIQTQSLLSTHSSTISKNIQPIIDDRLDLEDQYLTDDLFESKEPLYDLYYSERLLQPKQIEKMSQIDQSIMNEFKIEQQNKYIPKSIDLEEICSLNEMKINYSNIDLSGHDIPDVDSKVCLFSPYENPTRKFTNFKFVDFNIEQDAVCKSEEYLDKQMKYPSLIKYDNGIEGWYMLDLFYKVPQVIGYFNILFEEKYDNPLAILSVNIISKIFKKKISSLLSDALDAGYHIQVSPYYSSIQVKVVGWSENFNEVVLQLFQIWRNLDFSQVEYENAKEETYSELDDFKLWSTSQQGQFYFLKKVMVEQFVDPKILLAQLQKVSYEQVIQMSNSDKDNQKLICLIIGNIQAEKAQNLINSIDITVKFSKDLQEYRNVYGVFDIDSIYLINVKAIQPQQDSNRSVVSFYQIGKRNSISITEGKIISEILKEYMYSYFINEKKLVCKILVELINFGSVDGIVISLTSEQMAVSEIQSYLQESIQQFYGKLSLLLESQFQDIKDAQLRELNSNPPTLKDKADKLWKQLDQFNYVFDENDILITALSSTAKSDIISSFEEIFIKEPKIVSILIYNQFDTINQKAVVKSSNEFYKQNSIKIITNIFKQMKDRSFNMFTGEIV